MTAVSGSGYAGVSNYAAAFTYRAFGGLKGLSYGNGKTLATAYDNRLRLTTWDVSNVLGYHYSYDYFNEKTGRVTYAGSLYDPTLDRSYEYDNVGRLVVSHAGAEARAHAYSGQWGTMDGPYSLGFEYDVWGNLTHRYGWGGEVQGGTAGQSSDIYINYSDNKRNGFTYDQAGNLAFDLGQTFTYDATGQQATASYSGYSLQQGYDGDGLRYKKTENGDTTYYLRSSVLGGQVVCEIKNWGSGWSWWRGYVYLGGQLLAIQKDGVNWVSPGRVWALKAILLSLAVSAMTACSGVSGKLQENSVSSPTSVQPLNPSSKENRLQPKSLIRQVDFRNFSYPKLPTGKCSMDEVHLTNGKYEAPETIPRKIPSIDCWSVTLGTIDYGDVTGDGIEEAIVTLYAERGGTESSQDVYIYSSRGEAPALLWKFATGDRADGGRRRIAAENGELVVELFGVGTVIGKDLYGTEDVPDCCPEHYTRTKYKWQENRFQQDGPEEVLPNPSGDAIPVSPSPSPMS